MGPQTSYKQKKTTILQHVSSLESWCHSFPQIMQPYDPNEPKTHFLKNNKKSTSENFEGSGGAKPPGRKERLLEQVNMSFLTMSKALQSCLTLSEHGKNLPKRRKNIIL